MEDVGPEEELEAQQLSGQSPAPDLAAECQVCGAVTALPVGTGAPLIFVLFE
jgi:hypothetical protein